tara:strand:+ start:2202 stop:3146 length:945 start_codon:yes stop_codon:yes gene_type:complete
MKFTQIKIDILIPTYNRENTIIEAVSSAINQKEIIPIVHVIDNNSTDNTIKLLNSTFTKYLDKNLFIHKNNKTVSMIDNWNKSLSYVRNKYFKFLFSDDILDSFFCYDCLRVFSNDHQISIVTTDFKYFSSSLNYDEKTRSYNKGIQKSENVLFKTLCSRNCVGAPSNTLLNSSLLVGQQFIPNPIAADMIFFFNFSKDKKIAFLNKPLAKFRYSGNTVTNDLKFTSKWVIQNYEARNQLISILNGYIKKMIAQIMTTIYCLIVLSLIKYRNINEYHVAHNYLFNKISKIYKPILLIFSLLFSVNYLRDKIIRL